MSKHDLWFLYDMSLLETMEIVFSETITIDYYDDIIVIYLSKNDDILAWHGTAGHE